MNIFDEVTEEEALAAWLDAAVAWPERVELIAELRERYERLVGGALPPPALAAWTAVLADAAAAHAGTAISRYGETAIERVVPALPGMDTGIAPIRGTVTRPDGPQQFLRADYLAKTAADPAVKTQTKKTMARVSEVTMNRNRAVGARLREARMCLELKQADVAARVGVPVNRVSAMESAGTYRDLVGKVTASLGLSQDWVLQGTGRMFALSMADMERLKEGAATPGEAPEPLPKDSPEVPRERELVDVIEELESALHEWGAALARLSAAKEMVGDTFTAVCKLHEELGDYLEANE